MVSFFIRGDRRRDGAPQGHAGSVNTLCLLTDGRLPSGADDGTIRQWDVVTGTEAARFDGYSGIISALCPLPDGRLASGCFDHIIKLWNITTGDEMACSKSTVPLLGWSLSPPNASSVATSPASSGWRSWTETCATDFRAAMSRLGTDSFLRKPEIDRMITGDGELDHTSLP
jgi:WD40 repeat protein